MSAVGLWFTDDAYKLAIMPVAGSINGPGRATAAKSEVSLCRIYYTGNPHVTDVQQAIERDVTSYPRSTTLYQIGNEPNLGSGPPEQWQGGLAAYTQFFATLRSRLPGVRLAWAGISPIGDYLNWYREGGRSRADSVIAHVYGQTADDLIAMAQAILDGTGSKPVFIGECNFGPGPDINIDRNTWAHEALEPFLRWCARQPRIQGVLYFAYTWQADMPIGTPVDAKGTDISQVIQQLALEAVVQDIVPKYPYAVQLTEAHGPRRLSTTGIVIHTTRSDSHTNTLQEEYLGTITYFMDPEGDSSHFVVGPQQVCRIVRDNDEAYHSRENNHTHLGIEIAQPLITTPLTDFMYNAAADIVRQWCDKNRIPKRRVYSQYTPGIVGHEDTEQGKKDGKSDPGPAFDWPRFMRLVQGGTMPPTYDPEPDRAAIYAALETLQITRVNKLQAGGYPILADALSKSMEAAKRAISLSKGEH